MRLVIGISGASGSIYGVRLLERLHSLPDIETHLILSRAGEKTLHLETGKLAVDIKKLADFAYSVEDIAARLASGSFRTEGMVIAPCSMHTMSAIASGVASNLITRAADVILKERRRLVLMVRETPFHLGHLRAMVTLTEMGAIVAPPIPGFYQHPKSIDDLVDHSIDRVLDLLNISNEGAVRWNGPENAG